MLHAQSKGNGIHKSRVNGEDAPDSMATAGPTRSGGTKFSG